MMDHIDGKMIDTLEPDHIKRLVHVLDYFSMLKGDTPKSLSGCPCRGLLWQEIFHVSRVV
jgi:hypothetical protein